VAQDTADDPVGGRWCGGANTIVAALVLTGGIEPDGGYDRRAMIGHVFLWDPLFLVWGLLVAGLYVTRDGRVI